MAIAAAQPEENRPKTSPVPLPARRMSTPPRRRSAPRSAAPALRGQAALHGSRLFNCAYLSVPSALAGRRHAPSKPRRARKADEHHQPASDQGQSGCLLRSRSHLHVERQHAGLPHAKPIDRDRDQRKEGSEPGRARPSRVPISGPLKGSRKSMLNTLTARSITTAAAPDSRLRDARVAPRIRTTSPPIVEGRKLEAKRPAKASRAASK